MVRFLALALCALPGVAFRALLGDGVGTNASQAADSSQAVDASVAMRGWPTQLAFMLERFDPMPKLLGSGSFGEVWLARDRISGGQVAVKVAKKGSRYLLWDDEPSEMETASHECRLTMGLMDFSNEDPVGASRIAYCVDDQIAGTEGLDRPGYIVQQYGGQSLSATLRAWRFHAQPIDPQVAKAVAGQMLQAIRFLTEVFSPPFIHHDLRPDNVVVNWLNSQTPVVKLIDFGAMMSGTPEAKTSSYVCSPHYYPPEMVMQDVALQEPWHSFDVYAIGVIFLELLCPLLQPQDIERVVFSVHVEREKWSRETQWMFVGEAIQGMVREAHFQYMSPQPEPCTPLAANDRRLLAKMLGPAAHRPTPREILDSSSFQVPNPPARVPTPGQPVTSAQPTKPTIAANPRPVVEPPADDAPPPPPMPAGPAGEIQYQPLQPPFPPAKPRHQTSAATPPRQPAPTKPLVPERVIRVEPARQHPHAAPKKNLHVMPASPEQALAVPAAPGPQPRFVGVAARDPHRELRVMKNVTANFQDRDGRKEKAVYKMGNDVFFVKCCCHEDTHECRLMDLQGNYPGCDGVFSGVFWDPQGCGCMLGEQWHSFWRGGDHARCIVQA